MNKFETRKKLLVAESEVYRQLLKLEIQTFKVYGTRAKRRMRSVSTYLPVIMTGLPFVKALFAGKRGQAGKSSGPSFKRMVSLVMLGWKALQRFGPFFGRNKAAETDEDLNETAAEEYLSKRL